VGPGQISAKVQVILLGQANCFIPFMKSNCFCVTIVVPFTHKNFVFSRFPLRAIVDTSNSRRLSQNIPPSPDPLVISTDPDSSHHQAKIVRKTLISTIL